MHGAPVVGAAGILFHQCIDQFLCDALDDLIAIHIQITQQRQTDGQVATQIAVPFHQQHLCAMAGCCNRCRNTARAAAHDNYIILKGFHFHNLRPPVISV